MELKLKRAYEPPSKDDGCRILVDRLWPRGLRKGEARIDCWLKEIAPSTALRKWFGHDPGRWEEFQRRYFAELDGRAPVVEELRQRTQAGSHRVLRSGRAKPLRTVRLRGHTNRGVKVPTGQSTGCP
jgi:uncharacterized protein YeaO (DUF488 family)